MKPSDEAILQAVADGFEEQVAFLSDLVKIPSQRGDEAPAQDYFARATRARGYATEVFPIDLDLIRDHPGFSPTTISYDNVVNVVATHRPRQETGRSLILNGHMDVVPTGPVEMWTDPPYSARRDGDWLYGRGAGDMKAGLSANIAALDALRRLGLQPAATVYLQAVSEEECTGNGALACMARGFEADAAIIPEPEDDMLVRANTGVIWFRVEVSGKPVHVREAGTGANAIEATYRVIAALRKLEAEWNARRFSHRHFGDLDHPINFNVGKIEGGDWASSVPAWCAIDCRIAIYPGTPAAEAAREIEAAIAAAARDDPFLSNSPPKIVWNGFYAEGYVLEEGTAAEETLAKAHRTAHGKALESFVTAGYLDGRVFVIYQGIPCLVYGPLTENIHGFDERVSLSSLQRVTGAIALFIADWCGVEPIDGA
ncbi:ArgE/DapE family deacylase [Acuticoccus mangrovi]|uniref:ArgE/DapE family deacylase n=1 Tax=Acuticoccus mangrovi TaxID=2796142 RepID=A0A934IKW9_9HYPH|nr:ArgE/DapE family deacylase [Acuticoccus mangrovi]MBJ3775682.1 ArgE/DapE family deacylase [Acuticoccus mangrovi]